MCKTPLSAFQLEMNKLFDTITSEKFLVELLRESKLQNSVLNQTFTTMPLQLKAAFDKSFKETLIPYLDNLIFSVNKLQDNIKKTGANQCNYHKPNQCFCFIWSALILGRLLARLAWLLSICHLIFLLFCSLTMLQQMGANRFFFIIP